MNLPLNVDFTGKVVVVTGAGGVLCGEEKVTDIGLSFEAEALRQGVVLRLGKKNFKRVILR